ncbi:hypothetical protein TWF481_001448 [Arthrobotrys musiformis]|uniref:BRCT domain-containing protein n=1 Tax=Arthrobotrys musiformis TaxID=47236 RepID=A0AAV9WS83_9PEZI
MEGPVLRRSARKHSSSATRLISKRRRVSASKTAKANAKKNSVVNVATPVASKTLSTFPKSILKKSVHFASTPKTSVLCDKENDCPSEDELVAATITPKPSRPFTPASRKASAITVATTPKSASSKLHLPSTPRQLLFKKAATDLKRKYTPEASPPKSRRKIARLDDIELNEENESPVKHLDFRTYSLDMGSANTTLSTKKEKSAMNSASMFTPRATSTGIPVYNPRQGLHETPAKRPIKSVKNTPAIRAPTVQEEANNDPNPFHPSAKKAAAEAFGIHSIKKASSSKDIFTSTDSFVRPADSSKGWDFESKPAKALKGSQPIANLATPARRPPVSTGLLSASTANVSKPNRHMSRSLMSCPPKRPAVPISPCTPVAKKSVSGPKISDLATPARRPELGVSKGTSKKEESIPKFANMATPARRPEFGVSLKTPKNDEPVPKISSLATPARRPDFGASFAKPTASSIAKSTPTRQSPLKEAPRRPHGLSPLKSAVSMDEIKEISSPIYNDVFPSPLGAPSQMTEEPVARTPSPSRIPVKADQVSPIRPSIFAKSPGPKQAGGHEASSIFKGPLAKSATKAPVNSSTPGAQFLKRLFQTERKPAVYRDLDIPEKPVEASPVNRRLSFTSSPSPKKPAKAEFDIFVDEPVAASKKENDREDLVSDSITTAQVFAKSPPKTLGTRRESGIFLPSPDRAVSIGPFTQRLGGKLSPLRKEYEKEITESSGVNLVSTPTGSFFLDTMDAREIRTPKYVTGKTMIVPLKGCEEEDEEEDMDENEMKMAIAQNTACKQETLDEEAAVLSDIVVFLEVRTSDGADASASFVEDLKKLGAKVVKRWRLNTFGNSNKEINPMGVNLVVFKDGISQTLTKAKRAEVPCVGVAWIKECVSQGAKVPFDEFLIERTGLFGVKKQRRNSLVPKLHKCVTPRKTAPRKVCASGFNGPDENEGAVDRSKTD